ncbi:MAG: hypothetical protein K5774_07295 [Clostridia bacterium]|nr:hypothetical protein [Clostridia bacterium]
MTKEEALAKVLPAYERYYNVNSESPRPPFAAEAVFSLHDEQYFLIKSARISEADAREYAYFALADELTPEAFEELCEAAWSAGLERISPGPNMRSMDVSLLIIADSITDAARAAIRRAKRSLSHRFGFWGYTHYRICAFDAGTGRITANRMGDHIERTLKSILGK